MFNQPKLNVHFVTEGPVCTVFLIIRRHSGEADLMICSVVSTLRRCPRADQDTLPAMKEVDALDRYFRSCETSFPLNLSRAWHLTAAGTDWEQTCNMLQ